VTPVRVGSDCFFLRRTNEVVRCSQFVCNQTRTEGARASLERVRKGVRILFKIIYIKKVPDPFSYP